MILYKFEWAPSETIFKIGSFGLHYYSLMFVIAFAVGFYMMRKFYRHEKVSEEYLEPLFVFTIVGTLLGARLGEVFFYNWGYFQNHLIEILLPIQESSNGSILGLIDGYEFVGFRGLASHGAAIGIAIGLILFQRKYKFKSVLWIFDRLTMPVAIGGAFVRIGNFFNSEIVGKYTNSSYGVIFENRGETLPRHPVQLYETFGYVLLFFILLKIYNTSIRNKEGALWGYFLIGLFSIRFLTEYFKEDIGGIETFLPGLSSGQWLSLPFILIGIIMLYISNRKTI